MTLGFDTSGPHCAAVLLRDGAVVASAADDMGHGQAEHLVPMLERILAEANVGWADLDRIGVGIGPGNFTGIRIAVATARGLALALERPAVGVSSFRAIEHGRAEPHLAVVPGPRDQRYIAPPGEPPSLVTLAEAQAHGLPLREPPPPAQLVEAIARIAAAADVTDLPPPAPLYVKPADAAPPRDPAPRILQDDA
nr:tRNA (adenosine(37)-N6)-threonylcarbamoyltransferase complex dimerization subunit type 1 TsaB [Roseovarius salinarum]